MANSGLPMKTIRTSRLRSSTVLYSSPPTASRSREAAIVRDASLPYHLTIQQLPTNVRPRERLLARGPEALSDEELIAIILRTGTSTYNVLDVARALLAQHGGLDGVGRAS